uniref:Uncharacterized protein n=1 Tax=Megaselia scalaris TaxID=36166 RepID=T1GPP5_MEGSC
MFPHKQAPLVRVYGLAPAVKDSTTTMLDTIRCSNLNFYIPQELHLPNHPGTCSEYATKTPAKLEKCFYFRIVFCDDRYRRKRNSRLWKNPSLFMNVTSHSYVYDTKFHEGQQATLNICKQRGHTTTI